MLRAPRGLLTSSLARPSADGAAPRQQPAAQRREPAAEHKEAAGAVAGGVFGMLKKKF